MITRMLLTPMQDITQENISNLYSLILSNEDAEFDIERIQHASLYNNETIKKLISEKGKKDLLEIKYNNTCKNNVCPITFQEFTDSVSVIKLPCQHCFNPKAIQLWVNNEKAECPICRFQLDFVEK